MRAIATLRRTASTFALFVLSMAGQSALVADSLPPEFQIEVERYLECNESCTESCLGFMSDPNGFLSCLSGCRSKCEPPTLDPALYSDSLIWGMQQLSQPQQFIAFKENLARCLSECEQCRNCVMQDLDQDMSEVCPSKCMGGYGNCFDPCIRR